MRHAGAMHPQTVADAFGLGHATSLSDPVARGELGEIRRLETDHGTFAVKQEFGSWPVDEAETSTAYHRVCWEAGIPTPEPLRAMTGGYTAQVDGERGPHVHNVVPDACRRKRGGPVPSPVTRPGGAPRTGRQTLCAPCALGLETQSVASATDIEKARPPEPRSSITGAAQRLDDVPETVRRIAFNAAGGQRPRIVCIG